MKQTVMLTVASLLSILLLTLHITDDIVRGISKAEPSNIALAVLVVMLYGTLVLAEREMRTIKTYSKRAPFYNALTRWDEKAGLRGMH
jgi:hypothetical protein